MEMICRFQVNGTTIDNVFIDRLMPDAPGEYLKVYLYLLRHQAEQPEIGRIADALDHTEADVRRALRYWEQVGALMAGKGAGPETGQDGQARTRRERHQAPEQVRDAGREALWQPVEGRGEPGQSLGGVSGQASPGFVAETVSSGRMIRAARKAGDVSAREPGMTVDFVPGSAVTGLEDSRVPADIAAGTGDSGVSAGFAAGMGDSGGSADIAAGTGDSRVPADIAAGAGDSGVSADFAAGTGDSRVSADFVAGAVSSGVSAPGGGTAGKAPRRAARPAYSQEQVNRLSQDEDFAQLLYIAQKYMNKAFTQRECEVFAYLYDGLHMSQELLEYLVEHCVQGGHTSIRYIETVGLSWHEKGLRTVEEAKAYSSGFTRDSFAVMRAFGLSDRRPGDSEKEMISRWFGVYGFTRELVLEACNRTMEATHTPSFRYADKILSEWKKAGVKSLADVGTLDQKRQSRRQAPAVKAKANQFHNFEQRNTDYDSMVIDQVKSWIGES